MDSFSKCMLTKRLVVSYGLYTQYLLYACQALASRNLLPAEYLFVFICNLQKVLLEQGAGYIADSSPLSDCHVAKSKLMSPRLPCTP